MKSWAGMSVEAFKEAAKNPLVLVLDNVRSLNNVGSAFRTADAFLVEEILLCGLTGTPPNKEIEKTALGATASVKWSHWATTLDAVKGLQDKGYKVMAVEQATNSVALQAYAYAEKKPLWCLEMKCMGLIRR